MRKKSPWICLSLLILLPLASAMATAADEGLPGLPIFPGADAESATWVEAWFGGCSSPQVHPDAFEMIRWFASQKLGVASIKKISESAFLGFCNEAMGKGFTLTTSVDGKTLHPDKSEIRFAGFRGANMGEVLTANYTRFNGSVYIQYQVLK